MEEKEEIKIIPRSKKLAKAVEDFIKHLESLADTYPLVTIVLRGGASVSSKQYNEFLQKECTLITEEPKSYKIPVDKVNKYKGISKNLRYEAMF